MDRLINKEELSQDLMKYTKQYGIKEVNNVRAPIVRGKKVVITITSTNPAVEKLLIILIKGFCER